MNSTQQIQLYLLSEEAFQSCWAVSFFNYWSSVIYFTRKLFWWIVWGFYWKLANVYVHFYVCFPCVLEYICLAFWVFAKEIFSSDFSDVLIVNSHTIQDCLFLGLSGVISIETWPPTFSRLAAYECIGKKKKTTQRELLWFRYYSKQ